MTSLRDGLLRAVLLGGDTDTVVAITGGLFSARQSVDEIHAELPWYAAVRSPAPALVAKLASALAAAR